MSERKGVVGLIQAMNLVRQSRSNVRLELAGAGGRPLHQATATRQPVGSAWPVVRRTGTICIGGFIGQSAIYGAMPCRRRRRPLIGFFPIEPWGSGWEVTRTR